MSIKRYVREEEGNIYDRKTRRSIKVRKEKIIGNHCFVNPEGEDEIVIFRDDIEER